MLSNLKYFLPKFSGYRSFENTVKSDDNEQNFSVLVIIKLTLDHYDVK